MKEKEYLIAFRYTTQLPTQKRKTKWARIIKRCNLTPQTLGYAEDEINTYLNNGNAHGVVLSVKIMHFSELESDSEGV